MTMTLEELRADLATWQPRRTHDLSAIDAAIRERDELRTAVWFGKLCADAGADYKVRAEKAEAELAALKAKMDGGVIVAMCESGSLHALGVTAADKPKLHALNNCDHVLLVKCDD